jgi:hypothetical protein
VALVVGTILLAMVCPPEAPLLASLLVGAPELARRLLAVERGEALYRSLIQPELVLSYAQLERERYFALLDYALGAILNEVRIPELDAVLRQAGRAAGVVEGAAVRVGLMRAEGAVAARLTEEVVEALGSRLAVKLVYGAVAGGAIELAVRSLIDPVVAQLQDEAALGAPVGGERGIEARLEELLAPRLAALEPRGPAPGGAR